MKQTNLQGQEDESEHHVKSSELINLVVNMKSEQLKITSVQVHKLSRYVYDLKCKTATYYREPIGYTVSHGGSLSRNVQTVR